MSRPKAGSQSHGLGHLLWQTGLKTESGGFNTFADVFDPGNGRLGPAFS